VSGENNGVSAGKVLVIVMILIALAGIVFASIRFGGGSDAVEVYAEEVERRTIARTVKASGQIDPRVKVNLSSQVIGKIERLYVKEGDEVEAGQLILELEKDAFLAAHSRASADLRIAKSRQKQAQIDIEDALVKLRRMERLFGDKIASKADLESAELFHLSKELAFEQSAEAVTQAQASLDQANEELSKCSLYTPLSGRVITLNSEEGESVIPGTMNNLGSVIGTIADLSEILAEVEVDETEIPYLELDQPATVRVDALQDVEYTGTVVEIGSSGFTNARQPDVTFFRAKILLEAPDAKLRPGMSLRAEISTAESPETLLVPIQAVVERLPLDKDEEDSNEDDRIDVVFVVGGETASQVAVSTGLSDTTHVEIVSGLDEAQRVVTGPYRELRDLKDGDVVREKSDGEEDEKEDESS